MNNYIKIFDKFIDTINWNLLKISTYKLNTDYLIASNHLKALVYFHIAELKSLRDISDFMESNSDLKETIKGVSLASLSNYNNNIDFNVFIPVMQDIINRAMAHITVSERIKKLGSIKLIDSSTVSMALTYFKWAEFRSTKAGIKLNAKFDLGKGIPETIIISNAKTHDIGKLDNLTRDTDCIYVFDKGYVDYKKFDILTNQNKKFVTRLKNNAVISDIEELEISYSEEPLLDADTQITSDKIVYLGNQYINRTKERYRIVNITDSKGKELIFVTNIFDLTSEEIAWLYKKRWEIELFFKWIKQNLKIKKFIGHSLNAVMIQIITAIITFIILRLIQNEISKPYGLLKIKRLIKYSLTKLLNPTKFSWEVWLSG
ncbi:MAG: IS4 family transposase [Alkaliphilus sp.]|nr:IS4 family transposase [Alkaliphilus sp.]